ncbi:hypothetical protein D1872_229190 [compost metagenome]
MNLFDELLQEQILVEQIVIKALTVLPALHAKGLIQLIAVAAAFFEMGDGLLQLRSPIFRGFLSTYLSPAEGVEATFDKQRCNLRLTNRRHLLTQQLLQVINARFCSTLVQLGERSLVHLVQRRFPTERDLVTRNEHKAGACPLEDPRLQLLPMTGKAAQPCIGKSRWQLPCELAHLCVFLIARQALPTYSIPWIVHTASSPG